MRDWRLLTSLAAPSGPPGGPLPADGPTNMAVDGALLESVRDGAPPALRLYRWHPSTLSFGRNQPARGRYDADAAERRGIAFVRRPTGGQAVLHADELTYAVAAPVAAIGRPRDAYRRINRALVAGLKRLGVHAAVAGRPAPARDAGASRTRGATHAPPIEWSVACFRDPAEGEVVVGGRKLVGSAQRCEGRVVLQHGSILVSGSQVAAEELLLPRFRGAPELAAGPGAGRRAEGLPAWTTLEGELGGRPPWAALIDALVAGFEETLGTALAPGRLSVDEVTRARELRAHFASPEWTWRR